MKRPTRGYLYDEKCEELARYFCEDSPDLNDEAFIRELAATLQHTIELWCNDQERKMETARAALEGKKDG